MVDFPRRVSQPPKKLCESFMEKEVSIVLSRERTNHRKLAQEWYGLTDEQMVGMDVHHNPARHEGGRNIPEHLFVYHETLHSAVHGDDFTKWARKGSDKGKSKGGKKAKELGLGIHSPGMQALGGRITQQLGVGVFALTKEQQRELGRRTISQRWKCLITGHISTPGGLARFQIARGIDTSLRERIE